MDALGQEIGRAVGGLPAFCTSITSYHGLVCKSTMGTQLNRKASNVSDNNATDVQRLDLIMTSCKPA